MKVTIKPQTPGVPRAARVRAYAASMVVTIGLAGAAMKQPDTEVALQDRDVPAHSGRGER